MRIVNHGKWLAYTPEVKNPAAPPHTLYVRNDKDQDWYEYIQGGYFEDDTVKVTCYFQNDKWEIMTATRYQDRLFPVNQMVLEVFDFKESGNPHGHFAGKVYNLGENTIEENPDA